LLQNINLAYAGFFCYEKNHFFDGPQWEALFPITLTRPTCHIRIGILTIQEKWEHHLSLPSECTTRAHLKNIFNAVKSDHHSLWLNGAWLPSKQGIEYINRLTLGQSIWHDNILLAHYSKDSGLDSESLLKKAPVTDDIQLDHTHVLTHPEQIFLTNGQEINNDFNILTKDRLSKGIEEHVLLVGPSDQIFIGDNVTMPQAIINVSDGPVFIDSDAIILEGSLLRGPLSIGRNAVVKMGAKLYGETTIGPYCKVGGEVKRSILTEYSSKSHDGYLGDSVIGAWCNFGAGSNNSNMKNTYGDVNMWDMNHGVKRNTREQFCGLMMGDHSKCGINTQFNTGSVVGVFANIIDLRPDTYTPSFSWGLSDTYDIDKAITVARKVYSRKGESLSPQDENILRSVYDMSYS
jgi:UDP-N-acetylglucosamine diphosphorylase/glucosamine-1-phosphate N-acetyltransferase